MRSGMVGIYRFDSLDSQYLGYHRCMAVAEIACTPKSRNADRGHDLVGSDADAK